MMNEERMQILKMLESGKIKADEAARLLETMEAPSAPAEPAPKARWIRVKVSEGGRSTVNVRVPAALLSVVNRFLPEEARDAEGNRIDLQALVQAAREAGEGRLVEVLDEARGERIEVTLE